MCRNTPGNFLVPLGLGVQMGLCIQREKKIWAQFHLAVPRMRRESCQMAEGMLGLSTAKTKPLFPSRGKNWRLQQRVRAGGCWVSFIKGTTMFCHAKYLFETHFGTENLVFALCPAQQTNIPGAHDGAALARTLAASHAREEDPPDLPV